MKIHTLLLAFICLLFACKQIEPLKPESKIAGMWKLHLMEIKSDNNEWKEWRQGMTGYLLYEPSGYMSLHLAPKDYSSTNLRFKNFTDTMELEQLKYISQNYNYSGSYTIDLDSSIVSHTKLAHSNPNEWGEISRRKFSFSSDTLVVKPVEEENARLRLKFIKMPKQTIAEN